MKLAEYMEQNGLTDEDFAAKVGRDRSVVSRYRRGEVIPSAEVIMSIQTATDMAVQLSDWFSPPLTPARGGAQD